MYYDVVILGLSRASAKPKTQLLENTEGNLNPNLLKGNLDLILLAIIEPAAIYGSEITREASERSQGYFDFKEGTLYPALHRLEKAGFIRGAFQYLPRGGSPVKFYELTQSGKKELGSLRQAQQAFGQAMSRLLS